MTMEQFVLRSCIFEANIYAGLHPRVKHLTVNVKPAVNHHDSYAVTNFT